MVSLFVSLWPSQTNANSLASFNSQAFVQLYCTTQSELHYNRVFFCPYLTDFPGPYSQSCSSPLIVVTVHHALGRLTCQVSPWPYCSRLTWSSPLPIALSRILFLWINLSIGELSLPRHWLSIVIWTMHWSSAVLHLTSHQHWYVHSTHMYSIHICTILYRFFV